jgi:hypothetical protein
MSIIPRGTAIALATIASIGFAAAAGQALNLTSAQEQTIYKSLMNEKGQAAPSGFKASIGAKIPSSLTLHALPGDVSDKIPAVKSYNYVKLQDNQVLLANPKDRQVVEMIAQSSTTGSKTK